MTGLSPLLVGCLCAAVAVFGGIFTMIILVVAVTPREKVDWFCNGAWLHPCRLNQLIRFVLSHPQISFIGEKWSSSTPPTNLRLRKKSSRLAGMCKTADRVVSLERILCNFCVVQRTWRSTCACGWGHVEYDWVGYITVTSVDQCSRVPTCRHLSKSHGNDKAHIPQELKVCQNLEGVVWSLKSLNHGFTNCCCIIFGKSGFIRCLRIIKLLDKSSLLSWPTVDSISHFITWLMFGHSHCSPQPS